MRGQGFDAFLYAIADDENEQPSSPQPPFNGIDELLFLQVALGFHQRPQRQSRSLERYPHRAFQIVEVPNGQSPRIVERLGNDLAMSLRVSGELRLAQH